MNPPTPSISDSEVLDLLGKFIDLSVEFDTAIRPLFTSKQFDRLRQPDIRNLATCLLKAFDQLATKCSGVELKTPIPSELLAKLPPAKQFILFMYGLELTLEPLRRIHPPTQSELNSFMNKSTTNLKSAGLDVTLLDFTPPE